MAKCKTIDRLELTRRNTRLLHNSKQTPRDNLPDKEVTGTSEYRETERKGDKCPMCGQYTLHHVEGCETCHACGYSKCAVSW